MSDFRTSFGFIAFDPQTDTIKSGDNQGRPWCRCKIRDMVNGDEVSVAIWPDLYEAVADQVVKGALLFVEGKYDFAQDKYHNIKAYNVQVLPPAVATNATNATAPKQADAPAQGTLTPAPTSSGRRQLVF